MVIVSISLDDSLLRELEDLQREMGFSGRSDIIRSAVRSFISENKEIKQYGGVQDAVLIGIHEQSVEQKVTDIKHEHEDIIRTQTHTHISPDRCLEIFVLHGDSGEIEELYREYQKSDRMDYLRIFYT